VIGLGIHAVTPLDYWVDVWAALIRAHWYCTWRPGVRVHVVYRYIERKNHDFFGGYEYVEKVRYIHAVAGSESEGDLRVIRRFYTDR
jgi:hypothetical protein